jgi:hypothetical protein
VNVTDLGDFYYRYKPLTPPTAKAPARRDSSAAGLVGLVGVARDAGLAGVAGTGARVADSSKVDRTSPLYEQCRDFEAIFAKMMLKEMRATVDKTGLVSGGWAEDIFQDMLDDQYSKSMAKTANFGLADLLYRQLSNPR